MGLRIPREELESALAAKLGRAPFFVLTGRRGAGKSQLLERLAAGWSGPAAVVALEAVACTPEVLRDELARIAGPVLGRLRPDGAPLNAVAAALKKRPRDSLLLLDDITELRSLSYYPGVSQPLETILGALKASKAPCVATSRFGFWLGKQFPALPVEEVPPLTAVELDSAGGRGSDIVAAVSGGLPVYASHLAEADDLEAALVDGLRAGGILDAECRAGFLELLHRARGYGACKSALRVLATEEGLTLSEIARRLDRTPGSTRDYLRWLEEVDLIEARSKRFSFRDPLLRLWLRLQVPGTPVTEERLAEEVRLYVAAVSSQGDDVGADEDAFVYPPSPKGDLVEID